MDIAIKTLFEIKAGRQSVFSGMRSKQDDSPSLPASMQKLLDKRNEGDGL
jgi:hypothetical protein